MDRITSEFIKFSTIDQLNSFRLEGKPLLHVLHLNSQGLLEQQALDRGVDPNQRDANGIDYISLVNRWNRYVSVDVMGEIASFLPLEERQVLRGVNKEFKSVIDKMDDFQNLSEAQRQKIFDYLSEHDDIRSFEYVLERNMDLGGEEEWDNWAIREASQKGYLSVVERLLQDPRVDPSADDNGAIQNASYNGHLAVVERLLQDERVDPGAKNNAAIRWASSNGHLAVVDRLLQDPRVDPSDDYNHAIQSASFFNHPAIVQRLMQDPRVDPIVFQNSFQLNK